MDATQAPRSFRPPLRGPSHFWAGLRLTTKILVVFLSLSIVSLVGVGLVALDNMRGLGEDAIGATASLGGTAINDSSEALKQQQQQNLQLLARDQSAIANAIFDRVAAETNTLAHYAAALWKDPSSASDGPTYSSLGPPPPDVRAASSHTEPLFADPAAVRADVRIMRALDGIFVPMAANDTNLSALYVGTEYGGVIQIYPWTGDLPAEFDPRVRTWYRTASESNNLVWSEPYVDAGGKGLVVTVSKRINGPDGAIVGVAGVDVTIAAMNEQILATQIGERGYAFALDSRGGVIARPGMTAGDTPWNESFKADNLLEHPSADMRAIAQSMVSGASGTRSVRLDDGEQFVAYAPVQSTGWSIGLAMPVEEIVAPALATERRITNAIGDTRIRLNSMTADATNTFFGLFVGILVLVTAMTIALARTITRRLARLTRAAGTLERGQLTDDEIADLEHIEGRDEVASLMHVFASMAVQVRSREEKLQQEVQELRIEIDHSKKARQVAEITESDFFADLQTKARTLRLNQNPSSA